jgi:hypothetical protein
MPRAPGASQAKKIPTQSATYEPEFVEQKARESTARSQGRRNFGNRIVDGDVTAETVRELFR